MRLAVENRGIGSFSDLTRDGRAALLSRLVSRGDNNLYLVDLATAKETLLTPHEGPGSFGGAFSRDGRTVSLAEHSGRQRDAFTRPRLRERRASGPIAALAPPARPHLSAFAIQATRKKT